MQEISDDTINTTCPPSRRASHPSNPSAGSRRGRGLYRLAILGAVSTLFLVFWGGTVTSNDAGMAFPDWPTVEGQNMFVYPPSKWVGDKFYEHTHRLAGAFVGVVMIVLAYGTQRLEPRRSVRVLGWILLAGVIAQGVMGGVRVRLDSVPFAIAHGCFGQVFFSAVVCMAVVMSRGWSESSGEAPVYGRGLKWFCVFTTLVVFCQLIAGAVYRHTGQGLAIHVGGAIGVTLVVSWLAMWVSGEYHQYRLMNRLVRILAGLFVVQLALGVGAYVSTMDYDAARPATLVEWLVPSLHVAVGASILAISSALAVSVFQVSRRGTQSADTLLSGATTA